MMTLPEGIREPISAVEQWCELIYNKLEEGGGGGGGSTGFDVSGVDGVHFCYNTQASIDVSTLDTSGFTNMRLMFGEMPNLTSVDLSGFNTSNVTTMSRMFLNSNALTAIDCSSFDTSNVTDFYNMFASANTARPALLSLDISSFDTSSGQDFGGMFQFCSSLTAIDVTHFDTSSATAINGMFYGCSALTSLDLGNFDTSHVTNMNSLLRNCSALESVNLKGFTTTAAVSSIAMNTMIYGCTALTDIIWALDADTVQPLPTTKAWDKVNNTVPSDLTFWVRDSLVTSYQAASGWDRYSACFQGVSQLPAALQALYNINPQDYQ